METKHIIMLSVALLVLGGGGYFLMENMKSKEAKKWYSENYNKLINADPETSGWRKNLDIKAAERGNSIETQIRLDLLWLKPEYAKYV